MSKLGGDNPPTWLFVLAIIGLLLICILVYKAQAQIPQQQKYMLLYSGASGLNLDCVDEYPYTDVRRMEWNAVDGFTEIDGDYNHLLSIIAVESCNIDNVYTSELGLFVWRMTDIECERNRCAVHVNRGAWWIQPK